MRRREALQTLSMAAAMFQLPAQAAQPKTSPLPSEKLFARNPEQFWARIRKEQFLLAKWAGIPEQRQPRSGA